MIAKSTNHYKFTQAIIKNWCIIVTFTIFIYCVILVFELFFSPFNYRLFSALISNMVKK